MTLLSRASATLAELETRLAAPVEADALAWEAQAEGLATELAALAPSVRKLEANAKEADPAKRLYNAETSAKALSVAERFLALERAVNEKSREAKSAAAEERAARAAVEAKRQAAEEAQREAERLAALAARREQEEREARAAADKAAAEAAARKKAEDSAAAAAAQAAEAAARKKAEESAAAAAAAKAAADAEAKRVLDAAIARGLEQRRAQRQQQVPLSPVAPVAAPSAHQGGAVLELAGGSEQLRQLLAAHPRGVIVDWSAPWCGPCRMMAPHFAAAAAQWPAVLFVSINTEATPQNVALTREASISAYPTFQAYQNSSRIDEWRGADLAKLRAVAAQLASAGGAPPPAPVAAPQVVRASDPDAMAQRIAAALGTLRGATNLEELKAAVRALLTFVGNVIAHPSEPRYRRVRMANAAFSTSLGSKPGGVDAMLAFGFEQQSEGGEQVLVMPEAAAHDPALRQVKTMLEGALRAAGGDVPQPQAPPPLFPPPPQSGGAGAPPFPDFMAAMLGASSGAGAGGNLQALANALASNPMARAGAATMASNPEAVAAMLQQPQARAMMAQMNPALASMLDDPATVAHLVRMAAPAMSALASGSAGPLPGVLPFSPPAAAAPPPPAGGAVPMTDEEMLAEAIRRSLEDVSGGQGGGGAQ